MDLINIVLWILLISNTIVLVLTLKGFSRPLQVERTYNPAMPGAVVALKGAIKIISHGVYKPFNGNARLGIFTHEAEHYRRATPIRMLIWNITTVVAAMFIPVLFWYGLIGYYIILTYEEVVADLAAARKGRGVAMMEAIEEMYKDAFRGVPQWRRWLGYTIDALTGHPPLLIRKWYCGLVEKRLRKEVK